MANNSNNQKKYASLTTLQNLVGNIKSLFATKADVNTELAKKADSAHTHTIANVTNLQSSLDAKVPTSRTVNGKALTANISLSASDVGAEDKGSVSTHNMSTSAHNDIRDLITGLTTRLNTLANSDDTTLDQLSEIVAYIKSNKSLIDSITTNKVNVSDIINNLTTNVTNKPLSAAQGVEIKKLIDALDSAVDTHDANTTKHITSTERTNWNVAKTHADSAHAPSNAEKNQNAFSNIKVGTTIIAADTTTDTLILEGSNVTITPDATNDKVTISVADSTTSAKGVVKLTDSVTSTSTTTAATPNSVKSAYDLANTAKTTADGKANAVHKHTVSEISDLTATATELNYMDGVTSNVQLQLDEMRSNIIQSDWNQSDSTKLDYVKNRTHYTSIEPSTLVDETANCTMGSHTFSSYFDIEIGENYTVVFDETTYECTGFSDGGLPTIGAPYNKYTDYPFNIYTYKNKLYVITQEYGFYDIQIIGNAQVFHKIDERYLPDTLAKTTDLKRVENSISNKVNISSINGVELELSATVEDHGWSEIAYGNGKYVVVGGQSFMYSTDGNNWTMGTLPNSAQGIAYGNGVFCTYGYSGTTVCYSADGINWHTADTNYNSNKFGIVFLNGRFYISAGTAILHSANCVSWSTISLGKNIALSDGAYGNGTYVMCGDGYAVVSTNGTNWTTVTMPTNDYYDSVCFAKGRFVAFAHYTVNFGATNKIAYSIDGVNWTTGTLPISAKWVGAKYANGMFVVAGFTGMVYSADGDNWEVGSLLDGWSTVGCIGFGKELLFINEGQVVFGKINPYGLVYKADQRWNLLYDSGEISAIANSISNINVSGYTNIQVLVRCYNDGDSINSRAGSAIFTCKNGKTYQFPVWSNMFSKSINTVYTMATFNLVDGWLVCPYASRLIGDASTFEDEGGTAGNLSLTGSGMMKCTSQLSTLTISNLDQNSNYYFGMGSRVMVWGWNA